MCTRIHTHWPCSASSHTRQDNENDWRPQAMDPVFVGRRTPFLKGVYSATFSVITKDSLTLLNLATIVAIFRAKKRQSFQSWRGRVLICVHQAYLHTKDTWEIFCQCEQERACVRPGSGPPSLSLARLLLTDEACQWARKQKDASLTTTAREREASPIARWRGEVVSMPAQESVCAPTDRERKPTPQAHS